jgi:hypothetical protein
MSIRILTITLAVILSCLAATYSQELNCTVSLSTDQIKGNQLANSAQTFAEIKNIITDFMNNRRWSKDEFQQNERINCALSIILTQATAQGDFAGNATLTISRPVYGTTYDTPLFRFIDRNFSFVYQANTPLDYNENTYNNNLTQILAYYANLVLAIDYDSFGKLGGNPYVQKLQNIVNIVPSNGFKGWRSLGEDQRNRYWLAENLNNPLLTAAREGFYTYHRLSLDTFGTDSFGARKNILNYLNKLSEINKQKPASIYLSCFFDTKNEELINIFSQSATAEKQKVYTILTNLDPPRTENYRKLLL